MEKLERKGFIVYQNGTFKELVRAYSNDRMDRDPQYRHAVRKAVAARRAHRREQQVPDAVAV